MTEITSEQAEHINPLINANGQTYKVAAALTALAGLLEGDRLMEADKDEGLGLALLLQTCSAAMRYMDGAKECMLAEQKG